MSTSPPKETNPEASNASTKAFRPLVPFYEGAESLNDESTIPYSELLQRPAHAIDEFLNTSKPESATSQSSSSGQVRLPRTESPNTYQRNQGGGGSSTTTSSTTKPKSKHAGNPSAGKALFASLTMASAPDATLVPMPLFLYENMSNNAKESARRANAQKLKMLEDTGVGGASASASLSSSDGPNAPGRSRSTPKARIQGRPDSSFGGMQPPPQPKMTSPGPTKTTKSQAQDMTSLPSGGLTSNSNDTSVKVDRSVSLNMLSSILPSSAIVTTASPTPVTIATSTSTPAPGVTSAVPTSSVFMNFVTGAANAPSVSPQPQPSPSSSVAALFGTAFNPSPSPQPQLPPQPQPASSPTGASGQSVASALASIVPAFGNQMGGVPPSSSAATAAGANAAADAPPPQPTPASTTGADRMQMLLNKHKRK